MADHIACNGILLRQLGPALDLVEQGRRRELKKARKEIQSSTMRHTDDDVLHAGCTILAQGTRITPI